MARKSTCHQKHDKKESSPQHSEYRFHSGLMEYNLCFEAFSGRFSEDSHGRTDGRKEEYQEAGCIGAILVAFGLDRHYRGFDQKEKPVLG